MFCAKRKGVSVETAFFRSDTYELEFGLAARGDANGLDAFLARDGVVEAEEGLVGLDAVALVGFGDLEGEFEGVGGAERQWFGLLGEGESVG
jgi:hypothetical protein